MGEIASRVQRANKALPLLLLNWLAAGIIPAQTVPYHGKGIHLRTEIDQVYKIARTKDNPHNTGRKICILLQLSTPGLKFMAGNSKHWGNKQISHFSIGSNPSFIYVKQPILTFLFAFFLLFKHKVQRILWIRVRSGRSKKSRTCLFDAMMH